MNHKLFVTIFLAALLASNLMVVVPSHADAMGDPLKGEKIFKKCKACHTVDKDGKNKVGPNLWGIVGKKAGEREKFKYSDALKKADITWTDENLDKWIKSPRKFIKGAKMVFVGLKKEKDRLNMISYLKSLK